MLKRKKHRKNRFKRRPTRGSGPLGPSMLKILRALLAAAGLAAASAGYIYVHDMLVQSPVFTAQKVTIEGNRRLADSEVYHLAGLKPGINIFAPNLRLARLRLLTHPWIAEAQIQRHIPDQIHIQLTEHQPRALLVVGRTYLLSDRGIIFKEKTKGDPDNLPVVKGLRYADLDLPSRRQPVGKTTGRPPRGRAADENQASPPWQAVMEMLHLSRQPNAVIPYDSIREIRVDRQTGLSVIAFEDRKEIRIGFNYYGAKLNALQSILDRFQQSFGSRFAGFRSIDLRNPDRIVMDPGKPLLPKESQKEV